ncbi:SusC/RagA family TonB-linked outer membrane protein [Galbibacter mesophilus]|uniref:SusC/RagA family TonB-linked outer membrane protein n=1 Tax=Galbibacter mesophilus TaxID=379069 RepID=UPI00191E9C99|nr:SusC/RagA family TonB-linked outer membrane protein [Galbibacter mesophilus]MCM5661372.1 SusC/RagA family TonB-linked outer membrane protein [Galbibacter mesophilus]
MKQQNLLFILLSLVSLFGVYGQDVQISGVVTSSFDDVPLPGVNIMIVGTSEGTQTDFDGNYTITASPGDVLKFSYLGMKPKEVTVGAQTTINVSLEEDSESLDEVVVTAFGAKKEAKKLGYLVEEVGSESLTEASDPNLATALQGKVSGVDIRSGATGPGSSTNINIRGISSLSGSNQPLLVIDGAIVNNNSLGQGDFAGGFDYGDGLSNLNPDDIASVSVLKGGNATALYGFRGINGVLVITTKRGKSEKARVEINSTLTFDNVLVEPKLQNVYGQGRYDTATDQLIYSVTDGGSWGPQMDGSQRERFDGVGTAAYSSNPDDFKDYYDTGITSLNSINISQAKDGFDYKLSYGYLNNSSIQPGTNLKRHNFGIAAGIDVGERVEVFGKLDYSNQNGENRPELTDGQSNTVKALSLKPRNISNQLLSDNYLTPEGTPNNWNGSFIMNPYYPANTLLNEDETERYIGLVSVGVDLFKGMKATLRLSQDQSFQNAFIYRPKGAFDIAPEGKMDEFNAKSQLNNYDFLLDYNSSLGKNFSVAATFGLSHIDQSDKVLITTGETFVQDNIFSFNNFVSKNIDSSWLRSSSNSIFGSVNFGFKGFAFMEFSGRNDWSSTLPIDNASFFYPSVGGSLVLTDAIPSIKGEGLSYLKLRGNYAKTGNATSPYSLTNTYNVSTAPYNGQLFNYYGVTEEGAGTGPDLRNPELTAEISTSYEVGLDARFFNDRLRINGTYYAIDTEDQILQLSLPPASGANSQFINAGLITNKGVELVISGDIIKGEDFSWTSTLNFSKNENKIEELAQGIDVQIVERQFNDVVQVGAKLGESLWTLFGSTFERNENGEIIYDSDGLPIVGEIGEIGSTNPDALAGFQNTFRYKNISLSVLFDARFGGDIFSYSDIVRASSGTDVKTLQNREYFTGGNGFTVPDNAVIDGSLNPDVAARGANPQNYWGRLAQISENWVYDASFIKLREISLGYDFSGKFLDQLNLSKLRLSYIGRNLAILHKNTDNFDPETGFNRGFNGVEYFGFPSTSSHGFKLSIGF